MQGEKSGIRDRTQGKEKSKKHRREVWNKESEERKTDKREAGAPWQGA